MFAAGARRTGLLVCLPGRGLEGVFCPVYDTEGQYCGVDLAAFWLDESYSDVVLLDQFLGDPWKIHDLTRIVGTRTHFR